jgi:hypothetical protein
LEEQKIVIALPFSSIMKGDIKMRNPELESLYIYLLHRIYFGEWVSWEESPGKSKFNA